MILPGAARADSFEALAYFNQRDIAGAMRELTLLAKAGEADTQDMRGVVYDRSNFASRTTRSRELFTRPLIVGCYSE